MTSPIQGPSHPPLSQRPTKRRRLNSPEHVGPDRTAFKHVALPRPQSQIRLLRLHSGEREVELVCDLNEFDIGDAPSYRAISYTWGGNHRPKRLIVNGQYLMVGENCYYSLWQARLHHNTPQFLWIDCVCIDQSNKIEKSHQVGMIDTIFKNAVMTFACVGPDENDSSHLLDRTGLMGTVIVPSRPNAKKGCTLCDLMGRDNGIQQLCIFVEDPLHEIHKWVQSLPGSELERLSAALRHFSERSYWTRVWIQPEMVMSVEVRILCGDRLAKLDGLRWLTGLFQTIRRRLYDLEPELRELQTLVAQCELGHPMCQVLAFQMMQHIGPLGRWLSELISGFECYKPHDMFYAARGLLDWDPHFDVVSVDYRKSTIQLATEILPHLTRYGVEFPGNVDYLLELLSFDPTENHIDRKDLARLQAAREKCHWTTRTGSAPAPHEPCTCKSPNSSRTAMWMCQMLLSDTRYDEDGDPEFGTLGQRFGGGMEIPIRGGTGGKKNFLRVLEKYRPDNCLSLVGIDRENGKHEVIGVVTPQAKAGDVLIRSPGGQGPQECHNYLVLRRAFDDIYGIVGYAVLAMGVLLHSFVPDDDSESSTIESRRLRELSPTPLCGFDFWFDAEDVLADVLNAKDDTSLTQVTPEAFSLINRSFTRTKFSSFVTACFEVPPEDLETYCPECTNGYSRRICIYCGGSLGTPGSPYFRQDPIERLPFTICNNDSLEPLDTVALPRRGSANF